MDREFQNDVIILLPRSFWKYTQKWFDVVLMYKNILE